MRLKAKLGGAVGLGAAPFRTPRCPRNAVIRLATKTRRPDRQTRPAPQAGHTLNGNWVCKKCLVSDNRGCLQIRKSLREYAPRFSCMSRIQTGQTRAQCRRWGWIYTLPVVRVGAWGVIRRTEDGLILSTVRKSIM